MIIQQLKAIISKSLMKNLIKATLSIILDLKIWKKMKEKKNIIILHYLIWSLQRRHTWSKS